MSLKRGIEPEPVESNTKKPRFEKDHVLKKNQLLMKIY